MLAFFFKIIYFTCDYHASCNFSKTTVLWGGWVLFAQKKMDFPYLRLNLMCHVIFQKKNRSVVRQRFLFSQKKDWINLFHISHKIMMLGSYFLYVSFLTFWEYAMFYLYYYVCYVFKFPTPLPPTSFPNCGNMSLFSLCLIKPKQINTMRRFFK